MPTDPEHTFVSRGGLKLRHALDAFNLDVRGLRCADFGCNVGGFTDCLLQAGASFVHAVDTGYGALAWKLRQDSRVRVVERTNALHAPPPPETDKVDLVVIDMAWTPQRLCVPAAVKWLRGSGDGPRRIVTLIKPHYEATEAEKRVMVDGVLPEEVAEKITTRILEEMPGLGVRVIASTRSPVEGGKGKGNARGNAEWLAVLEWK